MSQDDVRRPSMPRRLNIFDWNGPEQVMIVLLTLKLGTELQFQFDVPF